MCVSSELVGIIVIEAAAGDLFALWSAGGAHRLANRVWKRATYGLNGSSVVMADLPRLHHELDREFTRLQDRLAA
jgi:hypothetical protein